MRSLDENVYLQRHPLSMAGCQLGRTVTLIRLSSGELVIHSTAKFSPQDVEEIAGLGEPAWMIEASKFHDTQARAGRSAFPGLRYLVPPGFTGADKLQAETIDGQLPAELEVIEIGGAPKLGEHAVFHLNSKTLILADLLFNLPPTSVNAWTRLMLRLGTGIKRFPGNCLLFRHYLKDRQATERSMRQLADLEKRKSVSTSTAMRPNRLPQPTREIERSRTGRTDLFPTSFPRSTFHPDPDRSPQLLARIPGAAGNVKTVAKGAGI